MSSLTTKFEPMARPGLFEMAHGETLRVIAATVGDTPDFKWERRALVLRARRIRTSLPGIKPRFP